MQQTLALQPNPLLRRPTLPPPQVGAHGAEPSVPPHPPKTLLNASSQGFGNLVTGVVNGLANGIYATDGTRYAFEEVAYTGLRTLQQYQRDKNLTNQGNPDAAREMLERDLSGDFYDTFLPGLLALAIGFSVDRLSGGKTLVRHNLGLEEIGYYQAAARSGETAQHFYNAIETSLKQASPKPETPLNLAQTVAQLQAEEQATSPIKQLQRTLGRVVHGGEPNRRTAVAQQLAQQLGLPGLDVTLQHGDKTLSLGLPELLKDLQNFSRHNQWGHTLAEGLEQTANRKGWQLAATGIALVPSLLAPIRIQRQTYKKLGQEANPGTYYLDQHFRKQFNLPEGVSPDQPNGPEVNPKSSVNKARLFPYLQDSWQQGNPWPALVTGGFFAAVGGVLANQLLDFKNGFKPKFSTLRELADLYKFDRVFPWTPVKAMAITYGLLCGVRMATSRQRSDFWENTQRDGLMGWPTLTWFYPAFRNRVARAIEHHVLIPGLKKDFGLTDAQLHQAGRLLMGPNGSIRPREALTPGLLRNALELNDSQTAEAIARRLSNTHNAITVASGLVSLGLIAYAEPKIGVWLTHRREQQQWHQLAQQYHANHPPKNGLQQPGAVQQQATVKPSSLAVGSSSSAGVLQPTALTTAAASWTASRVQPLPGWRDNNRMPQTNNTLSFGGWTNNIPANTLLSPAIPANSTTSPGLPLVSGTVAPSPWFMSASAPVLKVPTLQPLPPVLLAAAPATAG